jgi:hypothetical protein
MTLDLAATFGFGFALVLLLLIFIRAMLAVGHRSRWLIHILDVIIVPLVIVFLVVAFVRYVELSTPPLAPTPGPNPPRLVPSVSPLGERVHGESS